MFLARLVLSVVFAAAAFAAEPLKFDLSAVGSGGAPFDFSVALAEGNYLVTVTLGDPSAESVTTVRAELRRLMLEDVRTAPGEFVTRVFAVNVRTPRISTGGEVRLKDREKTSEAAAWDDRLTLEFTGARPAARSLEIVRADNLPTIYLAGDSTVTDQPREPFNSWGQMLTRFFGPGVVIANHAESGESLRSFIAENRLAKIMSVIRPGDYLFVQMGHNDQKEKGEGVGAFTTYQASLKRFIDEARRIGATPVLVTPMHRRTFDAGGRIANSLGDYPEAVRRTAAAEGLALIDLHAMSKEFYESLGPADSLKAFAPGDGTHHNSLGSYELARRVVEGIRLARLDLVRYLADDVGRPWQRIVNPGAADIARNFDSPPPEYGLVLWWGWDGPMTEEVIKRDLDMIRARGFPAVMIEAGYGMKEPYLSPGWFELVRFAVAEARRRNMRVWVEDEGKYPSGFAGGKFSAERPDLRMQALVVAERIPAAGGETIERRLPPESVGALAVNLADNASQPLEIRAGGLRWTAPEGKWQVLVIQHQFRTSPTRAVSNPTRGKDTNNSLGDYLNPEATRQFMAWTHEQYKQALGPEFGRTFLGFMGDEPDYSISGIPWTPALVSEFERRKGYDVRPYLALLFAPRPGEEARRVKADYWDVWSDLFAENFFRLQADWCAAHDVEYIVHLNHEDAMMALVRSEGDYFKAMRHVAAPGVDAIWNQIWPDKVADFPKLASSAAHLFGRPRAFTESFAAYKIRPNLEQAKWVLDHQLARGINMVQIMFQPSSANGVRPASGFMGAEQFPALARYVNRATYLLSMGRPAAAIGVYHPTSTMWLGEEEADRATLTLARQLLERQRDFDFVDEQALTSVLSVENGALRTASGNEYRTILVPGASLISRAALNRLRALVAAGGRVVFLGRAPALVAGASILKADPAGHPAWAQVEPAVELTDRVLAALPPPDVALDRPAAAVKYVHRRWRDADAYFFFNESAERVSRTASLAGSGQVRTWDAASGRIAPLAGATTANRVPLDLAPYESKFVVVSAAALSAAPVRAPGRPPAGPPDTGGSATSPRR